MLSNKEEEMPDTPAVSLITCLVPEWDVSLSIVDALNHGRMSDAAERLKAVAGMRGLVPLIYNLAELNRSKKRIDALSKIAGQLSLKPSFAWSLVADPVARQEAMSSFVKFECYKRAEESSDGLVINVAGSERTQLRFEFPGGLWDQVFVHYLMKADFEGVSEVFAAIRWLHGVDDEEVVLRFRRASVVLGQSIEIPLPVSNALNLISIGRHESRDVILLNGLIVYIRKARTPSPTGVTLDFIGAQGAPSRASIPLYIVDKHGLPPFCSSENFADWFERLVTAYSIKGELAKLSQCVHAFAGLNAPIRMKAYELAVAANLKHPLGYRDYLTDDLIEGLPRESQHTALLALKNKEPPVIIKVENATVRISSNPSLRASFGRLIGRRSPQITLLDSINFRAYAGDIVGIIGKNGAGKTTFLKTLVAAMPLSDGSISSDGRPILLRPGAGMQGDLTGRENVLKTGLYMGFIPNEIYRLMDEIIEFAELKDHIDRPFRYYSDGMRARLVFALATAIPRDILLLDELLSAGDMGFQRKAMKRLDEFIARAKLVFVVQHTFDFVLSRCTKCLLLDHGRPVYFGDPKIATELYKESL